MMESEQLELRDIRTKVTSILQILKGHELNKDDKGVIGVITDHGQRLAKLEKLKDRLVVILIVMAVPASGGVWDALKTLVSLLK